MTDDTQLREALLAAARSLDQAASAIGRSPGPCPEWISIHAQPAKSLPSNRMQQCECRRGHAGNHKTTVPGVDMTRGGPGYTIIQWGLMGA